MKRSDFEMRLAFHFDNDVTDIWNKRIIGIFLKHGYLVDESEIQKKKNSHLFVGVCLCYGCEFLIFFFLKLYLTINST